MEAGRWVSIKNNILNTEINEETPREEDTREAPKNASFFCSVFLSTR
jgi:hypothetical protein